MKNLLATCAALALLSGPALADENHMTFGYGTYQCSKLTAKNSADINNWIAGAWSGFNLSDSDHTGTNVGHSFEDATPIFERVKQRCASHPKDTIAHTTVVVYLEALAGDE